MVTKMKTKVNSQQAKDLIRPGASFPVNDNAGAGGDLAAAGPGVAIILFYLKTAERRTIKHLANMNNNGATDLQKQMVALALTEIDEAIADLMEANYGQ